MLFKYKVLRQLSLVARDIAAVAARLSFAAIRHAETQANNAKDAAHAAIDRAETAAVNKMLAVKANTESKIEDLLEAEEDALLDFEYRVTDLAELRTKIDREVL